MDGGRILMGSSPRTLLDLGVVLLVLLFSSIAISALDAWEAGVTARGELSLVTWGQREAPARTLDHDYSVVRNSMRRWIFLHFPLISLLGGAAVGLSCSGGRRLSLLAVVATGLVPITAAGWLIDRPGPAAMTAAAYAALAGCAAFAARRASERLRRQAA